MKFPVTIRVESTFDLEYDPADKVNYPADLFTDEMGDLDVLAAMIGYDVRAKVPLEELFDVEPTQRNLVGLSIQIVREEAQVLLDGKALTFITTTGLMTEIKDKSSEH